jgi:hypothetical protein
MPQVARKIQDLKLLEHDSEDTLDALPNGLLLFGKRLLLYCAGLVTDVMKTRHRGYISSAR